MKTLHYSIIALAGIFAVGIAGILYVSNYPVTGLYSSLTNSCASLGVSKIAPLELQRIQDSQEYQNIITLSDDDLKEAPKISDLVHKVSNKIDYNDQFSLTVSNSEMYQYHKFLDTKFQQQQGFALDKDKTLLRLEYDNDMYLFSVSEFPKNENSTGNVEFTVSENPTIPIPKIKLVESDFEKIKEIKTAIDRIGIYQVSSYESVGMPENEWNQYGKWFEEKYHSKFGNTTGLYPYFIYENKTYSASFSIC